MVSTTDVKRALSTLATRTDTATRPYTAVIDEGDAARDDLLRAAGFVEVVGLDRLEDAIEDAERDDRVDLADRGRVALDSYRRFRAVANGVNSSNGAESDRTSGPSEPVGSAVSSGPARNP